MVFIDLTIDSEDETIPTIHYISDDDSDIEFVDIPVPPNSKHAVGKRKRTDVGVEDEPESGANAPSNSDTTPNPVAHTETVVDPAPQTEEGPSNSDGESKPKRRAKGKGKEDSRDERIARQVQAREEKEYQKMLNAKLKEVTNKKEGIVFRMVINADGTLEDGSPAQQDDLNRFQPWRDRIEKSRPGLPGTKIKRFHWIVNYELEKRFEQAKEALSTVVDTSQELMLFHGTAEQNIDSILSNGFRIGGVKKHRIANGTAMGYGVYLAFDSMVSLQYAQGANRIFACRVCPGALTADCNYSRLPPRTENPLHEPYHTYNPNPDAVYVVRYACLVLPCYMIEFEQPQLPRVGLNANWANANLINALNGILGGGALPQTALPSVAQQPPTYIPRR
ncbi:hypothetical protein BDP27DRAFT_1416651 [Rhodocollybia butyracea]|uniref:PARP catalytic domain-containing protein n=1 Tax=Rhodocollybia butyracea TaxID=206335 RepID=A0A9P5Q498_9AGAR|nr:hypothetical protein BDP27DRAFT_1416651 [Rhodocollybia butyracea]